MNYFEHSDYLIPGIIIAFIVIFTICFFRRKFIIRRICSMGEWEKIVLLNDLATPFGFSYLSRPDAITSEHDAWQKDFGYCFLYDETAFRFHMIFDCEPIYFNFGNHTWLIEFWKGQYGINIGGEVGVYQADSIIPSEQYKNTLFKAVPEGFVLPISFTLYYKGEPLFSVKEPHWWLTGFRIGRYCEPEDLRMDICITFPCKEMLQRFVGGLVHAGYSEDDICICKSTVSLSFAIPHMKQPRSLRKLRVRLVQFCNRILCRLFIFFTRPFTSTVDRILYLYFTLPFLFRKILLFRGGKKQNTRQLKKCTKKTKRSQL